MNIVPCFFVWTFPLQAGTFVCLFSYFTPIILPLCCWIAIRSLSLLFLRSQSLFSPSVGLILMDNVTDFSFYDDFRYFFPTLQSIFSSPREVPCSFSSFSFLFFFFSRFRFSAFGPRTWGSVAFVLSSGQMLFDKMFSLLSLLFRFHHFFYVPNPYL